MKGRSQEERWQTLSVLVRRVERLVQAAARCDHPKWDERAATLDGDLTALGIEIERELTALTVEGLQRDLAKRKGRAR